MFTLVDVAVEVLVLTLLLVLLLFTVEVLVALLLLVVLLFVFTVLVLVDVLFVSTNDFESYVTVEPLWLINVGVVCEYAIAVDMTKSTGPRSFFIWYFPRFMYKNQSSLEHKTYRYL